jgi:hypothetical protein
MKKVVALKAKALIYAMPQVKTSTSDMHTGISSEVTGVKINFIQNFFISN